jgi:hypothetical protein
LQLKLAKRALGQYLMRVASDARVGDHEHLRSIEPDAGQADSRHDVYVLGKLQHAASRTAAKQL